MENTENNWERIFYDFLTALTSITHGKQQYFPQDDGTWYSRISYRYLPLDGVIDEYLDDMKRRLD